jgi:hypothetical protein
MNTPSSRLGADVGACEGKPVGFGPLDVVSHRAEHGRYIALSKARVNTFDDVLVRSHLNTPIRVDIHTNRQTVVRSPRFVI